MTATGSGNLTPRQLQFEDYLQRIPAEQGKYAAVGVPPKMAETDSTSTNQQQEKLMEEILSTENLNRAYKQVKGNKGAGGIDGMQVDELLPYLRGHREELLESLLTGKYRPKCFRRSPMTMCYRYCLSEVCRV